MGLMTKKTVRSRVERGERGKHLRLARAEGKTSRVIIEEVAFARTFVNLQLAKPEQDCCDSAWFSYRYMSAFERTERFAGSYERAFRDVFARYKDSLAAESTKPVEGFMYESEDVLTSLWVARQAVDELGIPYDFFLRVGLDHALQARRYGHIPRPNQLLQSWLIKAVVSEWERQGLELSRLFDEDWDRRFFQHGLKDAARSAAISELVGRINSKPQSRRALNVYNYVARLGVMSLAEALEHFGSEIVAELEEMGVSTSEAASTASPRQGFVPGCFGLAPSDASAKCQVCPVARFCQTVYGKSGELMIERVGSLDPKLDRQRTFARNRQRRHRAKKQGAEVRALS